MRMLAKGIKNGRNYHLPQMSTFLQTVTLDISLRLDSLYYIESC